MLNTQQEKRLIICKSCVHSKCKGNFTNKCDVDSMVCDVNNQPVKSYALITTSRCPKGYWESRAAVETLMETSSGGCGCGF